MRRSWQPASAFSRAGRSGGRPALQLPRALNPCGSSAGGSTLRPVSAGVGISRCGTIFAHPGRSGGCPALQHPRALNSCGSSVFRLHPDCGPQKSEISVSVQSSLIRGGLEGARPSSTREQHSRTTSQTYRLHPVRAPQNLPLLQY